MLWNLCSNPFRIRIPMSKKYVYLGYWVEGSSKMDYKNGFNSSEVLIDNIWTSV